MAHDYEAQRLGTFESFALMGEGVPARAVVAFQFLAEETTPDWGAAERGRDPNRAGVADCERSRSAGRACLAGQRLWACGIGDDHAR